MFKSNFKEKNEEEIKVGELNADDFNEFLHTLIPGNSSTITVDNYLPIMNCARRFLAPQVLAMCEKFILVNFDTLDKIDLLKMAFEYNMEELKDRVAAWMIPRSPIGRNCVHGIPPALFCFQCNNVTDSIQQEGVLNKNSFLVQNQEKLSGLPAEIHSFILKHLLAEAVLH